jgi:hypothetical protein
MIINFLKKLKVINYCLIFHTKHKLNANGNVKRAIFSSVHTSIYQEKDVVLFVLEDRKEHKKIILI